MDNFDYFKLAVEIAAPQIREIDPSDRGRAPGIGEAQAIAMIERYYKIVKAAAAKVV